MVEYGAAWELQRRLVAARKAGAVPDVLLLCEHPHVITLGRNGKLANLRASDHVFRQMGVSFFETDRGGDITYHGPGQLVGYPILNLAEIRRDDPALGTGAPDAAKRMPARTRKMLTSLSKLLKDAPKLKGAGVPEKGASLDKSPVRTQ